MDVSTATLETAHERYSTGEVIFREHDPANYAYVVQSGLVEISTSIGGERRVLTTLVPGEMFGELSALDGTPRSATATATTDTALTLIVNDQLRSRVEAAEPVLRLLMQVVLKRFRREQNLFRRGDTGPAPDPILSSAPRTSKGAVEKITLESDLREALIRNELALHYQPILDLSNSTITGFEALLRWQHTKLGTIAPQKFIGIAEETALIVPIGQWVLEKACRDLLCFEKYAANLMVCVNVSGRQFAEPAFLPAIADIVNRTGINPAQLELEITEGVLMDHRSARLRWIEQCKRLGIRVAIDDFGTGFSSLSYLASFDIDTLKIDRSFVAAMENDPRSLKIVRAISQLAHSLGLDVIAEGIENSAQYQLLAGMGVESGQGFLFSRAQPFDDAVELL